jgi:enamine deaminase RidA (YjgF/YER057c/UK114 family)
MAGRQPRSVSFINPPQLAPPPGYSQVVDVRGGRTVYIAGQAALNENGEVVGKGDFDAQARQVFRNLATALAAAGLAPRDLVKLTVFLRDMGKLAAYRKARDEFFAASTPAAAPAITLVEVSKLFSDELLIEIEAVAAA